MSADEPGTTPIQSVYAQRIAADLENNRAQQQQIGEQIALLQARLEQLKADEEWLSGLQRGAAPAPPTAAGPEDSGDTAAAPDETEESAVPQPRQEEPADDTAAERPGAAVKKTARKTTAKKAAAKKAPAKTAAQKTAARKTAGKAAPARKSAGPSLRELAGEYLAQQAEPRSAAEATQGLQAAHPERNLSVQLVRNALEKLVATGAAERSKQGTSVFYTSAAQGQAPSGAGDGGQPQTAQPEQPEQPEQVSEPAAADA